VDLDRVLTPGDFGEPIYVRFQPGRRLLVLYDRDGELSHLTILKPRRTE
jgi:hypothetical protein